MALSKYKTHLDSFSGSTLPPEERVRQALLSWMTFDLGYPKSSLVIEKKLQDLCPKSGIEIPNRRIDLVVFFQGNPLLLIECKDKKISDRARRQVIGYNYFLRAPFMALAALSGVEYGTFTQDEWIWTSGLPHFEEFLQYMYRSTVP